MADAADTVAVVLQPASGDVLQFLKAGIMEVPDVLVLTKTDLGAVADARHDRPRGRAARARRRRHRGLRGLVGAAPARHRATRRRARGAPTADRPPRAPAARPPAATRSRTSPSSTASAGCARSAVAGDAERWLEDQDPALDVPSLERALDRPCGEPRMRAVRRRQGMPRRIVLPAEPLIDGADRSAAVARFGPPAARRRLPGPRDLALDPGAVSLRPGRRPQLPAPAPRRAPRRRDRRRSRSSPPPIATGCSDRSR